MLRQMASNTVCWSCALALLFVAGCSRGGGSRGDQDVIVIDAGQPDTDGLDVADPDVADPDVVDPDVVDPDVLDPDAVDANDADPDALDPDVADADTVDPDTSTTEGALQPSFMRAPMRGTAGGRASGARFSAVFAIDGAAPPMAGEQLQLNPSPARVETPQ